MKILTFGDVKKENLIVSNELIIPEGYTHIYAGTFQARTDIEKITFPSTLQVIEKDAFAGCTSLKKLIFPKKLRVIGKNAFLNCTSLEEIIFEEGSDLAVIRDSAFQGCIALDNVNIPDTVTALGDYVFACCRNLKNISLSSSLNEVGRDLLKATKFEKNVDNYQYNILCCDGVALKSKGELHSLILKDIKVVSSGCFENQIIEVLSCDTSDALTFCKNAFKNCDITLISVFSKVFLLSDDSIIDCTIGAITLNDTLKDIFARDNAIRNSNIKSINCFAALESVDIGLLCDDIKIDSLYINNIYEKDTFYTVPEARVAIDILTDSVVPF